MNSISALSFLFAGVLTVGVTACQPQDESVTDPRCTWQKGPIDLSAPHHRYVVDSIRFGATPSEAAR